MIPTQSNAHCVQTDVTKGLEEKKNVEIVLMIAIE